MKSSNIEYYRIPYGTESWHNFRTIGLNEQEAKQYNCPVYTGGVGGSEIGTVLGLNKKYRPVVQELYHYKCGTEKPTQQITRNMLMGKVLEPIVKDIWCCYDGEPEGWVEVYTNWDNAGPGEKIKLQIRRARKVNAYIVNKKYPFLFVSLDYYAEKGTTSLFGKVYKDGFPVEIKTINGMYAKMWESEIPPYHVAQVNQQMLVFETDYAEIPILIDGREFRDYPFKRDDDLCDRIITYGKKFWDRVLEGRQYKKLMDKAMTEGDLEGYSENRAFLDSNEPEPDNSEAYYDYIKERFKHIINRVKGDIMLYKKARQYEVALRLIEFIEEHQTYIKNQMLYLLDSKNAEEIDFESLGKVTFYKNKSGNRTLRFNFNIKPTKQQVEIEFNKLNFNL